MFWKTVFHLLLAVLGALAIGQGVKSMKKAEQAKELAAAAESYNRHGPRDVDSMTTLTQVRFVNGTMFYDYRLKVPRGASVDRDRFAGARLALIHRTCRSSDTKKILDSSNVGYRYFLPDGTFLSEIIISKTDCFGV